MDNKLKDALIIIRQYQDWRLGKDVRTMREANITPAKITNALNVVLTANNMSEPLIDCSKCIWLNELEKCDLAKQYKKCFFKPIEEE